MLDGLETRKRAHICLGVCTYQRPEMLLRCLQSIRSMRVPDDIRLTVLVVDNELIPASAELVYSFSQPEIIYVHQPRRGIAAARNAILDVARDIEAAWVAMLDDDQIVPPDWLFFMWRGTHMNPNGIVHNSVDYEFPEPTPPWAFSKKKRHKWQFGPGHAATGGVMFPTDLRDESHNPLRFDERFALTGGEDRDFFQRAVRAGTLVLRTPDAVSVEVVPAAKLTYRAQVWRAYWMAAVNVRQDRAHDGLVVYFDKPVKLAGALITGATAFLLVPLSLAVCKPDTARKLLLKGGKRLAMAAGIAGGLVGAKPAPYRTIHGS